MSDTRRISRYETRSEIGRGSMGVVYLAHDPTLERTVALKTFDLASGGDDPQAAEFRERFVREARAAARLQHPNIVAIHDAGTDEESGIPFIAMEYVEGRTLKQIVSSDGPLDAEWVVETVAAIASALRAAHGTGLVHRDVKPGNILVGNEDGRARLADFGVARIPDSELTRPEISPGTPAYMAPEQLKNGPADARSDLFSLAAIFYEALTGRRPFAGDDLPSLALSIVTEAHEPPSALREGLPEGVDRFFDVALAKDPDARFQSAADFRSAVLDLAEGADRRDRPAPPAPALAAGSPLDSGETRPILAPAAEGLDGTLPVGEALRRGDARRVGGSGLYALLGIAAAVALSAMAWLFFDSGKIDVRLDAKSRVPQGRVVLEVNDEVVFESELRSSPRHKSKLLRQITGREEQSFEAWLELDPGKHEIVARVVGAGEGAGSSDTIVVDLERGTDYELDLEAGMSRRRPVSLSLRPSDPG